MNNAKFVTASEAVDRWREDILRGKPPTFYRVAEDGPLSRVEIGPKRILLVGGAPGSGKTGLVMQFAFDALRLSESLKVVVLNVEMPAEDLLDRQLSRLSGVPLDTIRNRQLNETHADRIDTGMATIESISDRLCFVLQPFTLENLAATVDSFAPLSSGGGLLLILDYIQRIQSQALQQDKRGSIDATMSYLRQFANAGAAIVAVSSVGRQKDSKGRSSYSGEVLNLASFKESGELEFGADDAYILAPSTKLSGVRELKHLKARHREPEDISLEFNGSTQSFTPCDDVSKSSSSSRSSSSLTKLWNQSTPTEDRTWKP